MTDVGVVLRKNYEKILQNIEAAASRSSRSLQDVTIIAVTKTVNENIIRVIFDMGLDNIGENRVRDAQEKAQELSDLPIKWHMVGHLQRNKVKKALGLFSFFHSVDSLRLAREMDAESGKRDVITPVLIEVNTGGEVNKFGVAPTGALELSENLNELENISLKGLMTMAPFTEDMDVCRRCFERLRLLRDEINARQIYRDRISELSMGMTQDYMIAVEEGATMVRIGSAFFEGIDKKVN